MSIRATHRIDDIQLCIFELLNDMTDAPFDRCEVKLSYPNEEEFNNFTSPFIYVNPPVITEKFYQQGGLPCFRAEIAIGTWTDQHLGGSGESNIINSAIINLFSNPQKCHKDKTFTVTLGLNEYSNTTLLNMGIEIEDVLYIRELVKSTDVNEFRHEIVLQLLTN